MKHDIIESLEQMAKAEPKFRLNMNYAPTVWQAECWQFVEYPNRNYLNSVWLGTVANFLSLPQRFWYEVILMTFKAGVMIGLVMLFRLVMDTVTRFFKGFFGCMNALHAPLEVIAQMRDSTDQEVIADQLAGLNLPVHAL